MLIVFTLTGCQTAAVPAPAPEAAPTAAVPSPESTPTPALTPVPEPDPFAEQLAAMTVEEKVGQLLIGGFEGTEIGDQATRLVQEYQVGGLILYGRNIAGAGQLVTLTNGLKALNGDGIPLFLSIDQEGGGVDRMPPEVRRTPGAYCVGQTGSVPAAQSYGDVLAAECAAFGLNLDFAPVLDVWSNPGNTVIGQRAFSADARTVAGLGPPAARRMMDQGIIPAVKHFPGHGDTAVDSHVGLPVVDKSPEELEETELIPFRAAIQSAGTDGQVPAVMVAHILLTQLDPERPASLSPAVVTGLLREELGFAGAVLTDDLTMGAVTQSYGLGEAAVLAVEAGCDILLVCHGPDSVPAVRTALLEAAASGRITAERLDESVYRILRLKTEYALTNEPVSPPDLEALNAQIGAVPVQ
ncbi:beta-N-acetylhexosaminidase [Intestinimonas massiliensis (ex Afouda et al. 2020)]|uniref:Beta-N-acetylhexosaminidase n=1 Tax=Intestinimonas massiliensis (ex Afouda et al. 2020) TaxID=1673721 RepID=A0ABS9M827_9FIRM|nr:beta-N-acetylhexosaminidase [Intestinimonas massiliensis (ex Afouda et al. 2020)]MCG4526901.1 beta-N-acetylhexosaminidase [Intestinimonas massiliensis (ex Afouda et al. 2020)]